jgi:hypothetical protein
MSAPSERAQHKVNIFAPVIRRNEKMKGSAIMPHVVKVLIESDLGYVAFDPHHVFCPFPKSRFGYAQRGGRKIKNRDVFEPTI